MRRLKGQSGFVLMFSIFVVVVLLAYGSIFVLRSVSEQGEVNRQRQVTQAFYAAEAGLESGLHELDLLINTDMRNRIAGMNPQQVAKKAADAVKNKSGLGFLTEMAVTFSLQGAEAVYQLTAPFGEGSYDYTITVQSKGDPYTVAADIWDFPYDYKIESWGQVRGRSKVITLAGDFTVRVQKDNFAKYALFSDHHQTPGGTTVWFTHNTNFKGPVHTNERFSFYGDPAGLYEGIATQQLSTARFHNNGSAVLRDDDANGSIDVPVFNAGFFRKQSLINLPSAVQKKDLSDQAWGQTSTPATGIYIPNDGTNILAGIYIQGDAEIQMGVDLNDNAVYEISQGADSKTVTVDLVGQQTHVTQGGVTSTYSGVPFGTAGIGTIIYVDGSVTSLSGTVQRNTEITVSAERDIVISGHLKYSDYNAAVGLPGDAGYQPPNADGKENLLGLVSWGGDVRIGTGAPPNIDVHGIVMAHLGVFAVDEHDNQGAGARGTCTLLGGMISQFYGAFGLFNATTGNQLSGYGRNFVYDDRMMKGKSPPYFPTLRTFVAFTNDITDNIVYWEGAY